MFKNAPLPMIFMVAIYVPVELALVYVSNNWVGLIPIGLVVVFFFLVVRGSRIAAILWGILWLFGALGAGYMAIQFIRTQPYGAVLLALYCLFFLASAGYLIFSPGLRRFSRAVRGKQLMPR